LGIVSFEKERREDLEEWICGSTTRRGQEFGTLICSWIRAEID
jgi:hypothetical protein